MKKVLSLLLLMMLCVIGASAQDVYTITGAVADASYYGNEDPCFFGSKWDATVTANDEGVTPTAAGKSVLYQNPGWPVDADGPADYTYNCD